MYNKRGLFSACSQLNTENHEIVRCCTDNCNDIADTCYSYVDSMLNSGSITKQKYDEHINRCSTAKTLCYDTCTLSDVKLWKDDPMAMCLNTLDPGVVGEKGPMLKCCVKNCHMEDKTQCKNHCEMAFDIKTQKVHTVNSINSTPKSDSPTMIKPTDETPSLTTCLLYTMQFLLLGIGLIMFACIIGFRVVYLVNKRKI